MKLILAVLAAGFALAGCSAKPAATLAFTTTGTVVVKDQGCAVYNTHPTGGDQVIISDASTGATVALTDLQPGTLNSSTSSVKVFSGNVDMVTASCSYAFAATGVPAGHGFYKLTVNGRSVQESEADMHGPLTLNW